MTESLAHRRAQLERDRATPITALPDRPQRGRLVARGGTTLACARRGWPRTARPSSGPKPGVDLAGDAVGPLLRDVGG
jgi:hypothetical protein